MINGGATHVGVATDHVIESFRNGLWPGYKTGAGIEPDLLAQFPLLEEALAALGVAVWPMVEFEADDALAAAAAAAAARSAGRSRDHLHAGQGSRAVRARHARRAVEPADARHDATKPASSQKFGVPPASIPDYLALVGDAADGYPGLQGWGAKSTAAVLARFRHLEAIPDDWRAWRANVANAGRLARTLAARPRPRVPLPHARDAPHRHPAVRFGRGVAVARADAGVRAAGGAVRRGA